MKRLTALLFIGLGFSCLHSSLTMAEEIKSLRGTTSLDELTEAPAVKRSMAVDGGIDVNFEEQPPLIPHSIDKTRISLKENSCLSCHNRKDSKKEDAPKPPKSHYITRDGHKLKKISTGRYFCTQCHVPQENTQPIVRNTFRN